MKNVRKTSKSGVPLGTYSFRGAASTCTEDLARVPRCPGLGPRNEEEQTMIDAVEKKKSEARALLRQFASELPNQWAVDGHAAAIMSGEEGIKDYVVGVLEAIHALREEFRALDESHADGDELSSRRWLADVFGVTKNVWFAPNVRDFADAKKAAREEAKRRDCDEVSVAP